MKIRPTKSQDISALKHVIDETGLFPSEMLEDMLSGFLSGGHEDIWLSCEDQNEIIGFCYAIPEPLTDGTWNMLAIAVHPGRQAKGAGTKIVVELETRLRAQGRRILIVDTSSKAEFAQTRDFYLKNGYTEEARIRDFWAAGDDKVVFRKSLNR